MEKIDIDLKIVCQHCKKETIIQDLEKQIKNLTPGYFEGEIFEGALFERCDHCYKTFEVPITVQKKKNVLIVRGTK